MPVKMKITFKKKIKNSSTSSAGGTCGGNTKTSSSKRKKQISPSKRWCFTLNNWTKDEYSSIVKTFSEHAKLYILGDEIGKTKGVPHIQGYVEFKNKVRPKNLVGLYRIHWEKARGTKMQNIDYCRKDGKVLISKGVPLPIKIISELYPWQKRCEELCLRGDPCDRTIYWYWDKDGNIGKSQFCKYMIVKHKALYCAGGKYSDIMNLVFNQNMDETKIVLFDVPRANEGRVSYSALESIKNGMVCNTKYETGVKIFNSPVIMCFANFPPKNMEKLSQDRWKIEEIGGWEDMTDTKPEMLENLLDYLTDELDL